jgi:very-short-patch-repair endonuclease
VDVVRRLGGHARACEVLAWTTRHRLWEAVHRGRLVRPCRGRYALPALPAPELVAARLGGQLSHASAARWWGLAVVREPDVVDVTVPRGARRPALPRVVVHSSRLPLDGTDAATPVLRTVLDCATTMPFPEALAVADSALAERFVRPDGLIAAARARGGPGRPRRLRVALAADHRADNAFESCLRGIVLDAGCTGFVPQLEIRLPGRIVHVDLGDAQRRVAIEAESFAHHGTREALVRDCERYNELWAHGWVVLRFAWEHVMFRQDLVARTVQDACRHGYRSPVRFRTPADTGTPRS